MLLQGYLAIGAIGALMNRVLQPHPLLVLGLNVWMGTAAGADELSLVNKESYGQNPGCCQKSSCQDRVDLKRKVAKKFQAMAF